MKRILLVIPAALLLAACGDSSEPVAVAPATSAPVVATTTAQVPIAPVPAANIYEVTEAGLTTAVNVPVTKSDAELAQGCAEAKAAMGALGLTTAEQLLAIMQATQENVSAGTVTDAGEDSWAKSTPAEQAALIESIRAAAADEC
ncbi:lipoprotein LpqV [Rhodococcus tibetensis]|uniref:Lipoprotein LpqV n=1 Tax=Rhodococcus tibetensis TaxID=2965064 RepID=A0ABT1QFN5_9NOCA|nr:lipoprotein LpqV [Rhodococcus sp. FXJ9.536]MCQ4119907.1 lipoprotein LpqV [Rhodococcus sp. FXJ9.536]